jgi:ERCC4-type nuclease
MLVSPAEPPIFKELGTVSSRCEERGCDFLLHSYNGMVGVQRKEISDLLASVFDGRLAREMAQMAPLGIKVLLLEGAVRWTQDGYLLSSNRAWTRSQHDGLLWSAQLHGCWVAQTNDQEETIEWLRRFQKWLLKKGHNQLLTRVTPKPGMWGTKGSKEWGVHFLMGIETLGYERAEAVWEHFGGVPMMWTVTKAELMEVPGIGPKTAEKMLEAVGRSPTEGQLAKGPVDEPRRAS